MSDDFLLGLHDAHYEHTKGFVKRIKQLPPDIIIKCCDKTWNIHRFAACAHSEWFSKALEGNFSEAQSSTITLHEDESFLKAIENMLHYFYEGSCELNQEFGQDDLDFAQLAVIADKYETSSLKTYSRTHLACTIQDNRYNIEDFKWIEAASVIYDHLTSDIPAHKELRMLALYPLTLSRKARQDALKRDDVLEFLRTRADAATDLLQFGFDGPEEENISEDLFVCGCCNFGHIGLQDCCISFVDQYGRPALQGMKACSNCLEPVNNTRSRFTSDPLVFKLTLKHRCSRCGGKHT